jgi:hypothetical protein
MTAPVEMTKGRATLPAAVVAEQHPFFSSPGVGLWPNDSFVENTFFKKEHPHERRWNLRRDRGHKRCEQGGGFLQKYFGDPGRTKVKSRSSTRDTYPSINWQKPAFPREIWTYTETYLDDAKWRFIQPLAAHTNAFIVNSVRPALFAICTMMLSGNSRGSESKCC